MKEDEVISMVIIIKVLVDMLSGGKVEDSEYEAFKTYMVKCNYDLDLLRTHSLLALLQIVCKDFSTVNLAQYWKGSHAKLTGTN